MRQANGHAPGNAPRLVPDNRIIWSRRRTPARIALQSKRGCLARAWPHARLAAPPRRSRWARRRRWWCCMDVISDQSNHLTDNGERTCLQWLRQIGATDIRYCGHLEGPPDFDAVYQGNRVAVEATRIDEHMGWHSAQKNAFERQLADHINECTNRRQVYEWHSRCEYDPREPRPPGRYDLFWKDQVTEALSWSGDFHKVQLLPKHRIVGRGVTLILDRASNGGSFVGVSIDQAYFPAAELCREVPSVINKKSDKVMKGSRSSLYKSWWLVMLDEICLAPIVVLGQRSINSIQQAAAESVGISQWSKVVLVSRYRPNLSAAIEYRLIHGDPLHS